MLITPIHTFSTLHRLTSLFTHDVKTLHLGSTRSWINSRGRKKIKIDQKIGKLTYIFICQFFP